MTHHLDTFWNTLHIPFQFRMPEVYTVKVEEGKPATDDAKPSVGPVYRSIYAKDGLLEVPSHFESPWDFFRLLYIHIIFCSLFLLTKWISYHVNCSTLNISIIMHYVILWEDFNHFVVFSDSPEYDNGNHWMDSLINWTTRFRLLVSKTSNLSRWWKNQLLILCAHTW